MPYEGEFAGYSSLRRLADSARVKALLKRSRIRVEEPSSDGQRALPPQDLTQSAWVPDLVLAVDGSHAPVFVRNGYPGAVVGYVTIAAVLLDVAKLSMLDAHRPVDPAQFRETETVASIDEALPGANVVLDREISAVSSLRKALCEVFREARLTSDAESLLETYEALLAHKPKVQRQVCPYVEDCAAPDKDYRSGSAEYICHCSLKRPLFSTDALRIHEGMEPTGENGAMFAEVMQVLERIWVVHVLRWLERRSWLTTLRRLAVVLDGPLAVFGHPAWLAPAISAELWRINERARQVNSGQDLLLIGVEKGGTFVEHLVTLDENPEGGRGRLPAGKAFLLSDGYIKRNIVFSESSKPYGEDTYFGRKFFYKTTSGALVVATLPFLRDEHRDTSRADPDQFPRLADALSLLDRMVSSRFPNSLMPLVTAHAEAAIPLKLGTQILEDLAKKLIPSE